MGRLQGRRRARQGRPDHEQRSRPATRRSSPARPDSITAAGPTSTKRRRGTARPARSSSTPTPSAGYRGRWCRRAGAASSSSSRARASRGSPSRCGSPTRRRTNWSGSAARISTRFERAPQKRDFHPVALGVTISASLRTTLRRFQTANVLGLLPGTMRGCRRSWWSTARTTITSASAPVGCGAGDLQRRARQRLGSRRAPASGGRALPGRPRPARSILFAAVGVEEAGLLGSEYFCRHPIVPAGAIAADLNFDGDQHLRPHPRRRADRPRQVDARRDRRPRRRRAEPHAQARSISRSRPLLPLRSIELCAHRRARGST